MTRATTEEKEEEERVKEIDKKNREYLHQDTRPIYLGYDKEHDRYHFYAVKDGTPRFLSYVTYFYWDRGPNGILDLVPISIELERELCAFFEGRLEYEFYKPRRNSRMDRCRKVYRCPQELEEGPSCGIGGDGDVRHDGNGLRSIPGLSTGDSSTTAGTVSGEQVQGSGSRRLRLLKSNPLQSTREEAVAQQLPIERPEEAQKKRGRPAKNIDAVATPLEPVATVIRPSDDLPRQKRKYTKRVQPE